MNGKPIRKFGLKFNAITGFWQSSGLIIFFLCLSDNSRNSGSSFGIRELLRGRAIHTNLVTRVHSSYA